MTTARILDFIKTRRPDGPCLVVDLDVVRDNFKAFRHALPDSSIYYAVKANPEPAILKLLASMGSSFDCASVAEIQMALDAGATADRISFGNTIKKERDVARAHALGVGLFDVLVYAHQLGLESYGVSFHVGSQMTKVDAWDSALADAKRVFGQLAKQGIVLQMVNRGGGFPTKYLRDVPSAEAYGQAIFAALRKHFGNNLPKTIIEPGRGMVGNAGVIKAEVVLVSKKSDNDNHRWVFLDIGKFGGLAETMDEAIRYPIRTTRDGDEMEPCVLAGPTCDSADVMYEKNMYPLPITLSIGDEVLIEGTGAYTTTYSAVAFNGFEPLKAYVI